VSIEHRFVKLSKKRKKSNRKFTGALPFPPLSLAKLVEKGPKELIVRLP
jgi:hypothetical protein